VGLNAYNRSMLGRDGVVLDHARAYWHEAVHILAAKKLDVPVAAVIYTYLKRLPDIQVSSKSGTAITLPERRIRSARLKTD
jgi:hypothetical protein